MKDELISIQTQYIALLGKALSDTAVFLYVHDFTYPQEDVEKGKELRSKIESLTDKLK